MNKFMEIGRLFLENCTLIMFLCNEIQKYTDSRDQFRFWQIHIHINI